MRHQHNCREGTFNFLYTYLLVNKNFLFKLQKTGPVEQNNNAMACSSLNWNVAIELLIYVVFNFIL